MRQKIRKFEPQENLVFIDWSQTKLAKQGDLKNYCN